ncbi:MAG: J domain-containing protein, partial [Kiloniellales bacterium]|nr:J domain-containing protein [Kiloniellales bacterium]
PATDRELPRHHRNSHGALGGIGREQEDPDEWLREGFYPPIDGRYATAPKANYYSHAAWDLYQKVLFDRLSESQIPVQAWREDLEASAALLAVSWDAGEKQILAAFRDQVKRAHPDVGGDPVHFRRLVAAKDTLLAAKQS